MDYLGWELERQRAALLALLGGGREEEGAPREGDAPGEAAASGENTAREGETLPDGTRRSPAESGGARRRADRSAGRYAGGRKTAGGPLLGAPGAWEMVREAAGDRLDGASGAPGIPVSAWEALWSGKTEAPARERRGGEETGAPAASRRLPEETRRTPRFGTGGAAELLESSGGRGGAEAARTAAEFGAEAAPMAETAGERRAGGNLTGPPSGRRAGGGAAAMGGTGTARLGGRSETEGPGERLSRVLPWGGGWESPALRAEAEARALSRAVQRDARRYDGGFTIY